MTLAQPRTGEVILTRAEEKWWRQCPDAPDCWDADADQPSAFMFRWDKEGELSGAREEACTAEEAYLHRTEQEKKASRGTWALTVGTVDRMGLQLVDDSANLPAPPESPPGHTFLDLRSVTNADSKAAKGERQMLRSRLLLAALRLGRHHPPIDGVPSAEAPGRGVPETTAVTERENDGTLPSVFDGDAHDDVGDTANL